MSLRAFHLLFIALSVVLAAFFAAWASGSIGSSTNSVYALAARAGARGRRRRWRSTARRSSGRRGTCEHASCSRSTLDDRGGAARRAGLSGVLRAERLAAGQRDEHGRDHDARRGRGRAGQLRGVLRLSEPARETACRRPDAPDAGATAAPAVQYRTRRRGPLNAELPRACRSQASTHAGEIDHMISLVHWLMLVMFVGWGAVLRLRAVPVPQRREPARRLRRRQGQARRRALEIAIVVAEMVLLVGYAIPAWARRVQRVPVGERSHRRARRRRAVRLEHPLSRRRMAGSAAPTSTVSSPDNPIGLDRTDPDAKDDITTINQLNLPVDRPVLVHLSSKDVIHSFGLFEMRVKQDAVPGLDIPVWFIPNRHRRLRDRLLAAVRPRPLPHARLPQHQDRRRLPGVPRGRSEAADAVATSRADTSPRSSRTDRAELGPAASAL